MDGEQVLAAAGGSAVNVTAPGTGAEATVNRPGF